MDHTPLEDILNFNTQKPGSYDVEFPPSVCFGIVTLGGLLTSVSHKAAQHFITRTSHLNIHLHLLQSSVYFFRPVFASPKSAHFCIKLANSSKLWTTTHVEVSQDGKVCMAGYLIFTNLSLPGPISAPTGWKLLPSPLPASLDSLEVDEDPNWVSYLTPLSPNGFRNVQAYLKYYIPVKRQNPNVLDQWVTPSWKENTRPHGAVWTNELLHFVIDNSFSYWQNYMPSSVVFHSRYEDLVAEGLEQRRARKENCSDRACRKDWEPSSRPTWVSSSVSMSTEVKKLLPEEGTKWLFMRCFSIKLEGNRLDEQIYLMDAEGDIVAVAQHIIHIIAAASKVKDKKALL